MPITRSSKCSRITSYNVCYTKLLRGKKDINKQLFTYTKRVEYGVQDFFGGDLPGKFGKRLRCVPNVGGDEFQRKTSSGRLLSPLQRGVRLPGRIEVAKPGKRGLSYNFV